MKYRYREGGISFIAVVFILILLAFVGLIGLKMFPLYMESFKIDKALNGVVNDVSVADQSKVLIGRALTKRLDIDGVKQITESNYTDYVKIKKKKNKKFTIDVQYRAEAHLFANVSVVLDFEKHVAN